MATVHSNEYYIPFTPIPGRKSSDHMALIYEQFKKITLKQKKLHTEKTKLESGKIPDTICIRNTDEFELINNIFKFNVNVNDKNDPQKKPANVLLEIIFIGTLDMFNYKYANMGNILLSNISMNKYLMKTKIHQKIMIISKHLNTLKTSMNTLETSINFNDYYCLIFEVVNAPANTYIILYKRRLDTISKLNFNNPFRIVFCVNTNYIIKLSNWIEKY